MSVLERKKILLLGATGSIGKSALEVLKKYCKMFELVGVAVGSDALGMSKIVNEFSVEYAAVADEDGLAVLKKNISCKCKLYAGSEGVIDLIRDCNADICISAIVGSAGLLPTITAIEENMDIALANKESLVAAGDLLIKLADEYKVKILPVDSEHSGLLQCMHAGRYEEIEKLIITASGGAFRDYNAEQLQMVSPEDALRHPTWNMGKKITVDCATLANKGLEVIEAHWLFNVSYDAIDVLVHRESMIHAMVEYCDGSIMAQIATADMSLPILYALTYPKRVHYAAEHLDFAEIGRFTFEKPNVELFPMLELAYKVGIAGGLAPAVYSAANEEAVRLFFDREISFLQIPKCVKYALEKINTHIPVTLDNILSTESIAHAYARDFARG